MALRRRLSTVLNNTQSQLTALQTPQSTVIYTHNISHPAYSSPIGRRAIPHDDASFIQRLHDLLRKGALLAIFEVLFELRRTTRSKYDAVLRSQDGVMLAPSQSYLGQPQPVLLLGERE